MFPAPTPSQDIRSAIELNVKKQVNVPHIIVEKMDCSQNNHQPGNIKTAIADTIAKIKELRRLPGMFSNCI